MSKGKKWLALLCLAAVLLAGMPVGTFAAEDDEEDESYSDEMDDYEEDSGEEEETEDNSAANAQYENQIDDLNDKIAALKDQKNALQQKINSASSELEKKMIERASEQEQVLLMKEEISLLEQKIEALGLKIDDKEAEVAAKQKEIDYNFEQYKKRMRATYMAGQSSTLSMLLGAADFTDLLIRSEFVRATAEHDEQLVQNLRDDRAALEAAQAELEKTQADIETERESVRQAQKDQEALVASLSSVIQGLEEEKLYYQQNKAKIDQEMKQAQAEVERIYELLRPQMEDTFVGGIWAWPLPGHRQITSVYAAADRSDNHTGTDIAGGQCYGASIVAANDGTVIFSQAGQTGYGHYVIVDHGGGYSSLYAHMSSISVSVGQKVARGQTEIGKVGETGWATGPHLHFEVRINGKPTNPMAFIS